MKNSVTFNLRHLEKNSYNYTHSVDYLRLVFNKRIDFFEKKLNTLSDNSNFVIEDSRFINLDEESYITYIKCGTGKNPMIMGVASFFGKAIPVIAYFRLSGSNTKACRIDIYGSYFALQKKGYFESDYLKDYMSYITEEDGEISRLDHASDYFINDELFGLPRIETIIKGSLRKDTPKRCYYENKGNLNSRNYGKRNRKNVYIRLYDKLFDSEQKGKEQLYSEYFESKKVYRLEFEFGPHFSRFKDNRSYKFSEIEEYLQKIRSFIGLGDRFVGYLFEKYPGLNKDKFGKKTHSYKQFILRGTCLVNQGLNPFLILSDLKEHIPQDQYDLFIKEFINEQNIIYGVGSPV